MSELAAVFAVVIELFKIEFSLYGFTFSLWQVFVFTVVASLVCWLIGEVFLGD